MEFIDTSPVVAKVVESLVLRSFNDRPLPIHGITESEAKRRVQLCERIWKVLRIEKKWSLQRCCDQLYHFLLNELDGIPWEPDCRTLWVPHSTI